MAKAKTETTNDEAEEATEAPVPLKVVNPANAPQLHVGRVKSQASDFNTWSVKVPAGTTFETAMTPGYWKHHTRTIQPGDDVRIQCDDGAWDAVCTVQFVSKQEIVLAMLRYTELESAEGFESDTHEVKWISPALKFGVVRKDTGAVIEHGFYPESRAYGFLKEHLSRLKT